MKDDALSPVVAMMLILAVVVTLFSLWNSIYLPGLKQQAEVGHLRQLEDGFLRIDADIHNLIALQSDVTLKETVPLGGGDIFLHPLRSGGLLTIGQEPLPVVRVMNESMTLASHLIQIRYVPVSNFWLNQGYVWRDGYVNITKGERATPVGYDTMKEVEDDSYGKLASLIFFRGANGEIIMVNFIGNTTSSGNGLAQVRIEGKGETLTLEPPVSVYVNISTPFGRRVNTTIGEVLHSSIPSVSGEGNDYNYTINARSITFRRYNVTVSAV